LKAIRQAVLRGSPFGPERWQKQIAGRLGLQYTLRPRGRPKKAADGPVLF
jgi:putative transposase